MRPLRCSLCLSGAASLSVAVGAALSRVHTSSIDSSRGNGGTTTTTSSSGRSGALTVDGGDMSNWVGGYVDRAVADGRQTPEAAAYFKEMLNDRPEFADCLQEARRLTGGQDPMQFTPYQQGLFADRLGHYVSGVASKKLMEVQQEEQQGKNFATDGSPTGEQYWYEAGTTLSSPAVPNYVKDAIFHDMQEGRRPDSPAFTVPPEAEALAAEDYGYAEHVRRQKQNLFSGADFSSVDKSP